MLNEGWRDQYERMLRAHRRLVIACSPLEDAGSDDARDTLYAFFEEAYKLKDWVKVDTATCHLGSAVERAVSRSVALAACADIANGAKHLHLNGSPRSAGSRHAEISSQGVTIFAPPAKATIHGDGTITHEVSEGGRTQHTWTVTADHGNVYDALVLANTAVADWDAWLNARKLL
ncbi:hypothetical protein [Nocardia brasiliensis]|uniref:hypothetical protein n=1 Tax=Nocardia brasiliensis TaxID=37326 RepID=UPI00366AF538